MSRFLLECMVMPVDPDGKPSVRNNRAPSRECASLAEAEAAAAVAWNDDAANRQVITDRDTGFEHVRTDRDGGWRPPLPANDA